MEQNQKYGTFTSANFCCCNNCGATTNYIRAFTNIEKKGKETDTVDEPVQTNLHKKVGK